jgi:hypothetical protein
VAPFCFYLRQGQQEQHAAFLPACIIEPQRIVNPAFLLRNDFLVLCADFQHSPPERRRRPQL